jgi:phage shock protein PspC (stress-responsive transcriptional regulator)
MSRLGGIRVHDEGFLLDGVQTLTRGVRRPGMQFVARYWYSATKAIRSQHRPRKQEKAMSESDELCKLGELHQRGVLSDDEFLRAKARVLSGTARATCEAPAVAAINALRRSRDDRWFGGVCGGIARITGMASWVWRVLFALLMLCGGAGMLVYVLMWVLVPQEKEGLGSGQKTSPAR